jgi:hypothetical protein
MFMTNINCTEIPVLIDEEIHCIDAVKDCRDHDSVGNVSVELVLVGYEGEITVLALAPITKKQEFLSSIQRISCPLNQSSCLNLEHCDNSIFSLQIRKQVI